MPKRADSADLTTLDVPDPGGAARSGRAGHAPGLTVVVHPDGHRIGAHATLAELDDGAPVAISRTGPVFAAPPEPAEGEDAGGAEPLAYPGISRTPLWIQRRGETLAFSPGASTLRVRVDGIDLDGPLRLPAARLDGPGIGIELGGCALLWLHRSPGCLSPRATGGMIGASAAIHRTIELLGQLADHPAPVLLRGESGTGKELAARALHRLGPRRDGPMLAVNVAALPASMAAAELFGHTRAAFTGAAGARPGWFRQADGGTLFLDEIGELAGEVQPLLLRALDAGEIQPLGGRVEAVDVRVVTATDADLEALVEAGRFRHALYERVASAVVDLRPLRERPVDAGLLFVHFLRAELSRLGSAARLQTPPGAAPWLRPGVVRAVMGDGLPGNARALRRMAIRVALRDHLRPVAEAPPSDPAPESAPEAHEAPDDAPVGVGLTVEAVEAALDASDRVVSTTARRLGVARNTLMAFLRSHPEFNVAGDLDAAAIERALADAGGDHDAAARALGVSSHGLKLRMTRLGLA